MPADFSEYVDLTLFDEQPGDIYLRAVELAQLSLPEFSLRPGTPEDAIFQAMSYISALNIQAINRVPNRLMAGIVNMLGYVRQQAIPAEMDVTITLSSYDGGVIPAGTIFSYDSIFQDEIEQFSFETVASVSIAEVPDPQPGDPYPSASATVRCLTAGVIPPISMDSEPLDIVSSGTGIENVVTFANFVNGINEDDDFTYLTKATTYLRSLTSAINKSTQLDSYILTNYPEFVTRVKTYDLTDGDPDLGDVTVSRSALIDTTFLNSNLATVHTTENHLFVVGDSVQITGAGATFNGTHEITATGDTTFSFVKVASNSGSTSVSGSVNAGIDSTGEVTVFLYGRNTYLTTEQEDTVYDDIVGKSVAGLTIHIRQPELLQLNLSGTIYVRSDYDSETVQDSIETALLTYLNPSSFPYLEPRIRKSSIISLIGRIPGVSFVENLVLTPVGTGWLPQHGDDILFLYKGSLPVTTVEDFAFTYSVFEV